MSLEKFLLENIVAILGLVIGGSIFLSKLDTGIRGLKENILGLRTELKEDILELKEDIAELRTELKGDIAELRTELKEDILRVEKNISELKTELKEDIAELKLDIREIKISLSDTDRKVVVLWDNHERRSPIVAMDESLKKGE